MWVVSISLVFVGLVLLTFAIPYLFTGSSFIVLTLLLFAFPPLVAGAFALTGRRAAFAAAAGVSLFFLFLFGLFSSFVLSSPANPFFWVAISVLPALLLGAVFSVLSLKHGEAGLREMPYLASRNSAGGLFTSAVIGFIVGALVVGAIGAVGIARILGTGGQDADIRIVPGAAGGAPEPFSPATFTVPRGTRLTWYNADALGHTVTSNTTGLFDSGDMPPGTSWSYTFDAQGTYEYHCRPHEWMAGTIIVT